jgi:ferredoxin
VGNIPEALEYLLDHIDIVEGPDEGNEIVKATYQRMRDRKCMLCGAPLGAEAMISINRYGIFAMACGGACYTDLPVMHWIQEQHEDMEKAIEFRGGAVNPDEPADEDRQDGAE